jgi:hypothetical protein
METTKTLKKSAWRRAILLAGIGVLSAGSVAGVSFALSSNTAPTSPSTHAASTSTSTSSGSSSTNTWKHLRRGKISQVLRRAVSGQVEVATKNGFVTVDFSRGHVTAVSSSSITILRADGQHVTEAVTSKTHLPKKGAPKDGDQVVVVSENGNALYVVNIGSLAAGHNGGSTKTTTPAKTSSSSSSTT